MARTEQKPKPYGTTAAQLRRDRSRKWPSDRPLKKDPYAPLMDAPHRVKMGHQPIDTTGGNTPEEFDALDWDEVEEACLAEHEKPDLHSVIAESNPQMADWERELLGADLPTDECEENEDYLLLEPRDEEPEWYGDHMLVTDDPPVDGYGMFRGVAVLDSGYGLDAIFGEGYRSGNCGFSVKTRP